MPFFLFLLRRDLYQASVQHAPPYKNGIQHPARGTQNDYNDVYGGFLQFLFDEFYGTAFSNGRGYQSHAQPDGERDHFVVLARTGFVKRTRTFVRNDLMTLTQRLLNFMIGTYLSSPVLYVGRQIEPCPVRGLFSSRVRFPHQTLSYGFASKGLGDPIEHEIGLERTRKRGLGRNTCRLHEPSTPLIRCLILNAMTALGLAPSHLSLPLSP